MTLKTYSRAPTGLPMMLRAALPAIPGIGSLPGVKHHSGSVPSLAAARHDVRTDVEDLEAYLDVCGFSRSDHLPPTYPHMAAFGLQMALMTDTSFPFAPMGLVHLRNSITVHRPIGVREDFDITVRAADLRPHPKGRLIDLVSTVSIKSETVWESTSTYLSRAKGGAPETETAPLDGVEAPSGVVHWRLSGDLGRRYGAVSGDRNPIHLHPLTAKAFGFPSNIAHGMWTKARALAAIQNKLPEAFTVDVEFKKPILLPSTVIFGVDDGGEDLIFGVRGSREPALDLVGPPHLVGRIS